MIGPPPSPHASAQRPALLDGLVDYAGLFPPAALDLDAAAAQYAAHLDQPEAWMLSRFVVPVAQAHALALRLPDDRPVELAVLGTGGDTPAAFLEAFDADLRTLDALHRAYAKVRVPVYEVRCPVRLARSPALRGLLDALDARLMARRTALQVFLEVPLVLPDGTPSYPDLRLLKGSVYGVKFRTGGLTADAFPSPEALAYALADALRYKIPFKCTAGLHHPVRMHRDEVATHMHGFLNVFGGAALLHAGALQPYDLPAVLADEDASAWGWTDEGGLRYRDHILHPRDVRRARGLATSYGSCSFAEPVDDLRAVGLL